MNEGTWVGDMWVRNWKGTTRPPHIHPEFWRDYSRAEKKEAVARFQAVLEKERSLSDGSKRWVRYNLKADSYQGTMPGGPRWADVTRRVTIDLGTGELVADHDALALAGEASRGSLRCNPGFVQHRACRSVRFGVKGAATSADSCRCVDTEG